MPEKLKRIDERVAEFEQGIIPSRVALSTKIEDYQESKVVLSFERYNQKQCEIAKLQNKDSKKLTNELKKMSETFLKHFRSQDVSRIACKPIHCSRNYAPIFNGLSKDVELLEIDYTGSGRIFGYLLRNIFNVVVIKVKHLK